MPVTLTVNGARHAVDADDDMPMLWVLRDVLHLPGTKFGCGIGACGACTVLVDGAAARSCTTALRAVQEHEVTTIEGLSSDGSHPIQQAWIAEMVSQCGYCQAGQIMSAADLLNRIPRPTDADIDKAMDGNLCRCGSYAGIRRAIHRAAQASR
jgi:isoquinoline 1-oxidoreductase subunit alpha